MSQEDIQVRVKKAVAAIIQTAKPKAKVYSWWVLSTGIGESVPYFDSVEEDEWGDDPFLHAYIVGFEGFGRQRTGNASFTDTIELNLWGFYEFRLGDADKNSEDVFSVHCKDIENALTKATKFQTVDSVRVRSTGCDRANDASIH